MCGESWYEVMDVTDLACDEAFDGERQHDGQCEQHARHVDKIVTVAVVLKNVTYTTTSHIITSADAASSLTRLIVGANATSKRRKTILPPSFCARRTLIEASATSRNSRAISAKCIRDLQALVCALQPVHGATGDSVEGLGRVRGRHRN